MRKPGEFHAGGQRPLVRLLFLVRPTLPTLLPLPLGEGRGEGNSPSNTLHAPRSTLNQPPPSRFSGPLARCYYQLGLYPEWEAKLRELGALTARDIEKSLRWDGVTYSLAGKGGEVVNSYLADRAAGTVMSDEAIEARFAALHLENATTTTPPKQNTPNKTKAKSSKPAKPKQK